MHRARGGSVRPNAAPLPQVNPPNPAKEDGSFRATMSRMPAPREVPASKPERSAQYSRLPDNTGSEPLGTVTVDRDDSTVTAAEVPAAALAPARLKAEESGLESELAALDKQGEKSTIEQVFSEIDVDNSGELTGEEFSKWWLGNGGDTERLATVQKAFGIIEMRGGKPGCTIGEFAEVRHAV